MIDGKFGYGQTVTPFAVRTGIEKCKKAGLAAIALRNAGHIGRVGDWAEMAAAEGAAPGAPEPAQGTTAGAEVSRRPSETGKASGPNSSRPRGTPAGRSPA